MQWLASISVRRPVFATVIILSLTVVGAFAFMRLGLDRFPKVDFPTVVVTTRLPGAAPEEVVIMNTLTVNLHLMMAAFYKPTEKKHKIMLEWRPFPSDYVRVI